MLLSFNERDSQGTRTIFYSVVILSSAPRKLLSLVSCQLWARCSSRARQPCPVQPGQDQPRHKAPTCSSPGPDPLVWAVVMQTQTTARPTIRALMFKRCSQESWALTCPDPTRNPVYATAEGKTVINPEIQILEVFGRKARICSLS